MEQDFEKALDILPKEQAQVPVPDERLKEAIDDFPVNPDAQRTPPLPEFEVSVIKPSKPDTKMDGDISGGQIKFQGVTLDVLIRAAWDLPAA